TGGAARDHAYWLRAGFDAIAVGRRTADRDDPMLTARGTVQPRIPPKRVVFSRRGVLRSDLQLVSGADAVPTILLTSSESRQSATQALAGSAVRVLEAAGLEQALEELRREGVTSLLLEGGAELAASFLDANLVDRIYWYQAPMLLGAGLRAFPQRTAIQLTEAQVWVPTERKTLGDSNLLVVDRELCLPGS
ncbi:MAG: RibD family protein, partial [Gemmatimonadales bacterium]